MVELSRICIGIVGLGKMGILHAGIVNALPDCSVIAFCEKEALLRRFAKKLLPNLNYYSSIGEMLAKEERLDAIYVATPITSHLPLIEELIASSRTRGVFVEKPLAGNVKDAAKIVKLASRRGLKNMVGFQKRFSPLFQKGKRILDEGILGSLNTFSASSYVSSVFSKEQGWRFKPGAGGALLDLGPHLIDALLWYFGGISGIEGKVGSLYSSDVDDYAQGTLEFESGVAGSIDISWSKEGFRLPELSIEVKGSNGRLKVTDDYVNLELLTNAAGFAAGSHLFMKPDFETGVDFQLGDPEYCAEDRYFIECLKRDESPMPDFLSGLKVNQVIEGISGHVKERLEGASS